MFLELGGRRNPASTRHREDVRVAMMSSVECSIQNENLYSLYIIFMESQRHRYDTSNKDSS